MSATSVDLSDDDLLQNCISQLGDVTAHNLGFVYVTDPISDRLGNIVTGLRRGTGIQDWVGTVGIGICGGGTDYFARPAMSVLTCSFADDAYRIFSTIRSPSEIAFSLDNGFVAGLGVVHADPRNPQTMELIGGLAHDYGTYLVGGLSAATDKFDQVANTVEHGGVSGVMLGGSIQVAVGLSQGCTPIGPPHTVTSGERQIIATLDGRPAFELLCEDLGVADGVDPRPWLDNIHAAVLVSGSDTGDYLVRNLMGVDPGQGLVAIAEDVPSGARIMFVRRDAQSAAKDLDRMIENLKQRLSAPAKAGLYFSCVARGPNLFDEDAYEVAKIREAFGDMPLAGFYGNGEICNDRVYAYTGVLTLFL
ncbi:MAG: FIST signal transduction protein [Hyphomicrobiaceae bacterium]